MKLTKSIFYTIILFGAFAVCNLNICGQKNNVGEEIRVKFPRGKTSTVISGKIKNNLEGPIYLVGVSANQKLRIRLIAASGEVEIIIKPPETQDSFFLSKQKTNWSDTIASAGDCQIIINPKRDNFTYKLEVSAR